MNQKALTNRLARLVIMVIITLYSLRSLAQTAPPSIERCGCLAASSITAK
jgi:hypothetical protein